jgi:hypothetical protein
MSEQGSTPMHCVASLALALATALAASTCFVAVRNLTFSQSVVRNTPRVDDVTARVPPGFIYQSVEAPGLVHFRRHIEGVVSWDVPELERIASIRRWVRDQQSDDPRVWEAPGETVSTDPEVLLRGQRTGLPGACRRFSYVLLGALLSAGFQARFVSMTNSVLESANQHAMVEVWVEALDKWVLVDATLDTMFVVDGRFASLPELRAALLRGEHARIRFERNGSTRLPQPRVETYAVMARHAWFGNTNAVFDGYRVVPVGLRRMQFVHLVDAAADPYPEGRKNALLCAMLVSAAGCAAALRRFTTYVRSLAVPVLGARTAIPSPRVSPLASFLRVSGLSRISVR